MIDKIADSLRVQGEALKLRSLRQQALAGNLVNADTPNYKAVDFDFARAFESAVKGAGGASGANGMGAGSRSAAPALVERSSFQPSLDANSVDVDTERARFADNALRYEAALTALNSQIKTMMAALQG